MTAPEGLGRRLRSGGSVLLVRQLLGGGLGFAATMVVTGLIGPAPFGEYASALAIAMPVVLIGQWGVVVGIVRRSETPSPRALAEASGVVLIATLLLALIAALVAWLTLVGPLAGGRGPALVMIVIAPIATAGTVQLATLERDMAYRRIALGEFSGQCAAILVAVGLAFCGFGAWAPALGWCAQQIMLSVLWLVQSGSAPRWRWPKGEGRDLARFGRDYTVASVLWQLRSPIMPVIIGHSCGPAAVGALSLAAKLVDSLSIARAAVQRLAASGLRHADEQGVDAREFLALAGIVGVVGCGVLLGGFSVLAPWVMSHLLGQRWDAVLPAFAVLGALSIVYAVFIPIIVSLHVRGHSLAVARYHAWSLAALVLIAPPAVHWLGWGGYLIAESCSATTLLLLILHHRRHLFLPDLRRLSLAAFCWMIAPFAAVVGTVACLPAIGWCLLPSSHDTIRQTLGLRRRP